MASILKIVLIPRYLQCFHILAGTYSAFTLWAGTYSAYTYELVEKNCDNFLSELNLISMTY